MEQLDEIKLINDCLKGNEKAFKAIYNLYKGYTYSICIRYGIQNIEVKDCMQVIFMEIFRSLSKYDPSKAKFKTWLTRIAINHILNYKKKTQVNMLSLDNQDVDRISSDSAIPIESILETEHFYKIINRMPPSLSSVFNLFIIDGYSHSEIAEKLNITVGGSRILLHRGRAWAKKEFQKFYKDFEPKKTRIK